MIIVSLRDSRLIKEETESLGGSVAQLALLGGTWSGCLQGGPSGQENLQGQQALCHHPEREEGLGTHRAGGNQRGDLHVQVISLSSRGGGESGWESLQGQ